MANSVEWRGIPGWEDRYEVSSHGSVRSKDMLVGAKGGATATRKGRVLARVSKQRGYLYVTLARGSFRPQLGVHVLVARAFHGAGAPGLHVLHGDGDNQNNHKDNLRYGTPADNHADTKRHGRRRIGENHPHAKLDEDAVLHIRSSAKSLSQLAALYGVSREHICSVRNRRCWTHI